MCKPMSLNVFVQMPLHFLDVFESSPSPKLLLNLLVESFDLSLESLFVRGCENRNHFQRQTKSNDFSNDVFLSRSLKHHVVVKLYVFRQSESFPMFNQRKYSAFSSYRLHRKRVQQVSMKRNSIEELNFLSAVQVQAFEDVETVEFVFSLQQSRQIPSRRWSGTPYPRSSIDHSVSFGDIGNGSTCGHVAVASSSHFVTDGFGSVQTEDALFLEMFSELEDTFFEFGGGFVFRFFRTGFFVLKVDAIESFSFGDGDPSLDGGFCFIKTFCDVSERHSRSVGGDHLPSFFRNIAVRFCLSS